MCKILTPLTPKIVGFSVFFVQKVENTIKTEINRVKIFRKRFVLKFALNTSKLNIQLDLKK